MTSPLCTSCGGDFCEQTTEVSSEGAEDILSERDAGVLSLKPDVLILKPDILPLKPDISRKSIV